MLNPPLVATCPMELTAADASVASDTVYAPRIFMFITSIEYVAANGSIIAKDASEAPWPEGPTRWNDASEIEVRTSLDCSRTVAMRVEVLDGVAVI